MSLPTSQPPEVNPVLAAYESFLRDTPLVTRYIVSTLFVSWFASFFYDPSYALGNIPYFVVFRFELYRLVISPLLCLNILSLVFAYISFVDNGKRLEFSMGSTGFAFYILTIGLATNILFLVTMFGLYFMTEEKGYIWSKSVGIWTILFGLIATECSRAPRDSQRRLFFFTVPTIYYPLALWALFCLLGGVDMADLLSVGVGYAYGHGYLDMLKVSSSWCNRLEETILLNFTRREGWVTGHAASGSGAWSNETASQGFGSMFGSSLGQQMQGVSNSASSDGGFAAPGRTAPPVDPAFPTTGGRALGSATTTAAAAAAAAPSASRSSEARAAMLAAAERRARSETKDQQV